MKSGPIQLVYGRSHMWDMGLNWLKAISATRPRSS